jgi:hypothetical protein
MFRGNVKSTGYTLHSPVSLFTSPPVRHRVPSHFNWSLAKRRGKGGGEQVPSRCRSKCTDEHGGTYIFLLLTIWFYVLISGQQDKMHMSLLIDKPHYDSQLRIWQF